jgi:hypothetical protein
VRRSGGSEFDSVCARFGDARDMSGNPVGSVSTSLIDVGSADTWGDASSYGTTKSHQQTYWRDDARVRLDESAFAIQPGGTQTDCARQVSQTVATRRVSTERVYTMPFHSPANRFTTTSLAALPARDKPYDLSGLAVAGLVLRVSPTGTKS